MPRVTSPQPGNKYKVVCVDNQTPPKEVEFTFINVTDGRFEIEVEGERQTVDSFCSLCHPWACEVHSI